jgi:Sulfate permease family
MLRLFVWIFLTFISLNAMLPLVQYAGGKVSTSYVKTLTDDWEEEGKETEKEESKTKSENLLESWWFEGQPTQNLCHTERALRSYIIAEHILISAYYRRLHEEPPEQA